MTLPISLEHYQQLVSASLKSGFEKETWEIGAAAIHEWSGFANAVGGVRRNAWKSIWILFPNSLVWKLAGALRTTKNTQRVTSGSTKNS